MSPLKRTVRTATHSALATIIVMIAVPVFAAVITFVVTGKLLPPRVVGQFAQGAFIAGVIVTAAMSLQSYLGLADD